MRNRVEFDEPLSDQIVQAPRRSYQNIHAATKRLDLRALFHTAENRQMLQTDIFSVIRKLSPICTANSRVGVRIRARIGRTPYSRP